MGSKDLMDVVCYIKACKYRSLYFGDKMNALLLWEGLYHKVEKKDMSWEGGGGRGGKVDFRGVAF